MSSRDDLRRAMLERLEANLAKTGDLSTDTIFDDLAPATYVDGRRVRPKAVEVHAVIWQFIREGLIVPGSAGHGLFSQGGNEAFRQLPFFEYTAYGREVLKRLREDTDPASATDYLGKVRKKAPKANETVLRYVGESVSTFNNQEYLGSAVLLGVAAEEFLEQLYVVIGTHVNDPDYTVKLNGKRWASQRLEYARARLRPHLTEFDVEFQNRVDQYLDMLAQIIKMSRDDVGHGRPVRVDRELASMNLVAFPVLAGIVDELLGLLVKPCTASTLAPQAAST